MDRLGRVHRLLQLVTLLQSGVTLTAEELAKELDVSRRTLFRDLRQLEAADIPFYHKPGVGYRIAPGFFLPPVNLKVTEAMGLMILAKSAVAQPGYPLTSPAEEAVRKLMTMLPDGIREVCHEMISNVSVKGLGTTYLNNDSKHYLVFQQAIDQKRKIQLNYDSIYDKQVVATEFHPYHLHFVVRAWYVIGYSDLHQQIRTFKLSRIDKMELLEGDFHLDKPFDINAYLGKAWLIIPEGQIYDVELEFSAKVARNVSEVHWHPTQDHEILDDGRCVMRFEVDGINEISWWLLGYGDQVIVRKPTELRQNLIKVYTLALERNKELDLDDQVGAE